MICHASLPGRECSNAQRSAWKNSSTCFKATSISSSSRSDGRWMNRAERSEINCSNRRRSSSSCLRSTLFCFNPSPFITRQVEPSYRRLLITARCTGSFIKTNSRQSPVGIRPLKPNAPRHRTHYFLMSYIFNIDCNILL